MIRVAAVNRQQLAGFLDPANNEVLVVDLRRSWNFCLVWAIPLFHTIHRSRWEFARSLNTRAGSARYCASGPSRVRKARARVERERRGLGERERSLGIRPSHVQSRLISPAGGCGGYGGSRVTILLRARKLIRPLYDRRDRNIRARKSAGKRCTV